MRLTRIYHIESLSKDACFPLPKDISHRLVKVLRAKLGDQCIVFDGKGSEALCEITGLGKSQVTVQVTEILNNSVESSIYTHLFQALCKNDKMDWVIQKSVELGVSEITPVITKHCDVRISKEKFQKNHEKWQKIIISACEQSGRSVVPKLNFVRDFSDVDNDESASKFILTPSQGEERLPRNFVARNDGEESSHVLGSDTFPRHCERPEGVRQSSSDKSSQFSVLIGPEGGFHQSEVESAISNGWQATQLGPRILRTETAAIVMLSLVQNQFGDFK